MNKKIKLILVLVIGIFVGIIFTGMFKFNCPANNDITNTAESFLESEEGDEEILFTQEQIKNFFIKDKNGINDCENGGSCDDTIDYLKPKIKKDNDNFFPTQTLSIPAYDKLKVLEENEFQIEVSRELKDCTKFMYPLQKCMQVKKEGGEWKLFYDYEIYGFNYIEGNYYVLKILEKKYDFDSPDALVPTDHSSTTWEVLEVIKNIPKK